jgi:hypothetical protein
MVEDAAGRKIFPSVVAYFAEGEDLSPGSAASSSVIAGLRKGGTIFISCV